MSSNNSNSIKEIANSPIIRIVNFFLMLIISLIGTMLLRAEKSVFRDIQINEQRIEALEGKVETIKSIQIETVDTLEYIKEGIDELKEDLKELKNR